MSEERLILEKILRTAGNTFPVRETSTLKPVCGLSLSKGKKWWKAIVLVRITTSSGDKYQLRLYAWAKNNNGEWKLRQKFNISKARYVSNIVDVLTLFAPLQSQKFKGSDLFTLLSERISQLEEELAKERERRKRAFIQAGKQKLDQMTRSIRKFSQLLAQGVPEQKIHEFLKKPNNAWFFGPEYRKIYKEEWITTMSSNDFLLEKHDGYVDIVELKGPASSLFDRRLRWSGTVKDGVSQLMHYLSEARKKIPRYQRRKTIRPFSPKRLLNYWKET